MTKREFLEKNKVGVVVDEEMAEFAAAEIQKLDHTNEVRRDAAARKAVEKEAEKAPIRTAIVNVMTAEPKTASALIAEAGVEIKPQAIPSLLKGLVEDGSVVKSKIKVKGKGEQVGYAKA